MHFMQIYIYMQTHTHIQNLENSNGPMPHFIPKKDAENKTTYHFIMKPE